MEERQKVERVREGKGDRGREKMREGEKHAES